MNAKANLGLVILAMLALLVLGSTSATADLTDGLVAHWNLDEGTGNIAHDSAGDNDGIIYGAAWTDGIVDGALSFDGSYDYVMVGDKSELETAEVTLSFWAQLDNPSASFQGGVGKGVLFGMVTGFSYKLNFHDGSAQSAVTNTSDVSFGAIAPISDSDWHLWTMTAGLGELCLYKDGTLQAGPVAYAGIIDYTKAQNDFVIGARYNGLYSLDGKIDDVRVYNRALSSSEIQQLYQEGLPQLVNLELTGPDDVAENFQAQYKATALYDNDSTSDVTASAVWSVAPNNLASISAGLLQTESINFPQQDISISAQYTEGPNTVSAQKPVSIFAVCPTGSALQFDGENDFVCVSDNSSLTLTDITLMAWVKTSDKSDDKHIITNYHTQSNAQWYHLLLVKNTGKSIFQVDDGSGTPPYVMGTSDITDGQWHHIAGVRDTTSDLLKIFVDGIFENSIPDTTSAVALNPMNDLWIGGQFHFTERYFNGIIDEVSIFNQSLSAEQIQADMHRKLAGDEPGLVAYWNFDEGAGQVAYDLSANANDGRLGSTTDSDTSDPAWIVSDAPVGICTFEGLVQRNFSDVLDIKMEILELLDIALDKEQALFDMLDTSLEDDSFGTVKKGDIVKSKQKIHSAIQHEDQAGDDLNKSLEKLDDAADALNQD